MLPRGSRRCFPNSITIVAPVKGFDRTSRRSGESLTVGLLRNKRSKPRRNPAQRDPEPCHNTRESTPTQSFLILFSCLDPLSPIRGFPWLGAAQRRRLESVVNSSSLVPARRDTSAVLFFLFGCGFAAPGQPWFTLFAIFVPDQVTN